MLQKACQSWHRAYDVLPVDDCPSQQIAPKSLVPDFCTFAFGLLTSTGALSSLTHVALPDH